MNNKQKLCTLKSRFGFVKLCDVTISDKTKRLYFEGVKKGSHKDIIYAITIDDSLVYIGKSGDFHKRTDTYKNARYWKNAWPSNKNKTKWLERAIIKGQKVEVYYRKCVSMWITTPVGKFNLTSMHAEEPRFIKKFNPPWNIQHNR